MKPHLPLRLFRAVFSCLATVSCLTLGSGIAWAEEQASIILGEQDTLTIDYADAETLPDVGGILQLLGGTQLNLSNCGEGDGKTYTLATGVSALLDAEGNELLLDSSNNTISHYFDTTQPGVGFWADATLSLSEDGTLQLVRHNETVKAAQTITTRKTSSLVFSYYERISFEDISYSSSESNAYGGAIFGGDNSTITLNDNGSVTFSGNSASTDSSSYRVYASGGAIYGGDNSSIALNGNGSVTFSGNTASASSSSSSYSHARGGAIYGGSYSTIELSENGSVTFSGNTASSYGGAISGGTITLSDNGSVEFSGNTARYGGAIGGGTIELSGNGSVTFIGNTASSYGGAIYGYSNSTITLSDNGSVTFSGNTASSSSYAHGGAIYGHNSTITLSGNGSVTFSGNTASSSSYYAYGGAIYGEGDYSTITLSDNGSVTFSGNRASSGGAIYGYGNVSILNNDSVLFEKNAEISGATYRLCSIRSVGSGAVISLSASAGKSIEFRDSVALYCLNDNTVNLNADYTDANGMVHKQTGDIIFTGKYTEQHLNELLVADGVERTATAEEIRNSRTTEVYTMTNLYGGRLRVEDGAIYKGYGITAMEDSAATVLVKGGILNHAGYDLTFNAGTTLELAGENTLYGDVRMLEGSHFSVSIEKPNADYIFGHLQLGGDVSLSLSDSVMGENAILLYVSGGIAGWNEDNITLLSNTVGLDDLTWVGNMLVLNHNADTFNRYFNGEYAASERLIGNVGLLCYTEISFENISGGAIYGGRNNTIALSGNGSVTFIGNTASDDGGAIHGDTITLDDNESVTFSGNTASRSSGAISGYWDGAITLSGNGSVEFSGNSASDAGGGAISGGTITLSDNESVTFSGNSASSGGAICGSTITLSGNGSVEFSGNSASIGGAIEGTWAGAMTLNDNGSVTFSDNSGGAIEGSTITLADNESVTFSGNTNTASSSGGAISGGTITLSGNGSVEFSGNSASDGGGAIEGSTITLSDNGSVTFSGNTDSRSGGAIHCYSNLSIRNNDSVLFEKNAEISGSGGSYRLRSIYAEARESVISLSAAEGKSIEFRDSVYIASGNTVKLNADYTDAEGVMHKQTGDIIFTGKYTEQHLNELLAADGLNRTATEAEILNSRTTEVYTMTNLYGGRLRVEDGAIYKGNGITVHKGSAASVLLKDAELSHSGYDITFNAGTTLELSGHNTITAAHLNMEDGSIMKFMVDAQHTESSALTYNGRLNMADGVALQIVSDDSSLSSGSLRLLTLTNGSGGWNTAAQNCAVIRLANEKLAGNLSWQGNTLYLDYREVDGTVDWEGGDGRWDGISGNWGQGDNIFSFTGQVDLFFGDKGSGTITIAGSFSTGDIHVNNSEGNDYHWKNDDKHAGCLHGDHSFHKEGKGDLTVDVELSYTGTTQVDGGTLTLNGSADLTGTFSNNGKLVINGSTTLGGDYEGSGDIEITGKLKLDKHDIEIGKGKDKDKADVHNNGKGNDDNIFSADNEDYEIKNGHVVAKGQNGNNGNNGLHLGNKLTDTSVENAGEETLVITHGENSLNGVHANKGNVEVYGKDKHRLQDITISGNLSVSFMTTGWEEGIDEYREAEISIFGTADFESNAILIADLILESGCKLTMDGAVHMGSDVTLNLGTTLNGRLYEDALNLAHAGEYVVLFDSVDSLILNNGTTSITYAPGELTLEDGVAANIYFTNLGEDSDIYITFVPGDTPVGGGTGTNGGEIRLTRGKDSDSDSVPEPSTSMLGLMGLVAFTLRRRRK